MLGRKTEKDSYCGFQQHPIRPATQLATEGKEQANPFHQVLYNGGVIPRVQGPRRRQTRFRLGPSRSSGRSLCREVRRGPPWPFLTLKAGGKTKIDIDSLRGSRRWCNWAILCQKDESRANTDAQVANTLTERQKAIKAGDNKLF